MKYQRGCLSDSPFCILPFTLCAPAKIILPFPLSLYHKKHSLFPSTPHLFGYWRTANGRPFNVLSAFAGLSEDASPYKFKALLTAHGVKGEQSAPRK